MSFLLAAVLCALPGRAGQFSVAEGNNLNFFYRDDRVQAHAVATVAGRRPRLVVAFPTGNSGAGIWFAEPASSAPWLSADGLHRLQTPEWPAAVELDLELKVPELRVEKVLLDSVRALRDFKDNAYAERETALRKADALLAQAPAGAAGTLKDRGYDRDILAEWLNPPATRTSEGGWQWRRRAAGSAAEYRVALEPAEGMDLLGDPQSGLRLVSRNEGPARFHLRASVGFLPLTPIEPDALLNDAGRRCVEAAPETSRLKRAVRDLAFLSYEEKLLAGSWQYLTYFGRDTLITAHFLAPLASPALLEGAIRGAAERLAPDGTVAHEEDIADQAAYRHLRELVEARERGEAWDALANRLPPIDAPVYDYKMVDSDFFLPLVAADYLAAADADRAQHFLESAAGGGTVADALTRNVKAVLRSAEPYAQARAKGESGTPLAKRLVSLRPGQAVGDWRDSTDGLGGGRYPSSINLALVAASVRASAHVLEAAMDMGFEDAAGEFSRAGAADRLEVVAQAWDKAPEHFKVTVGLEEARARVERYIGESGFSPLEQEALRKAVRFENAAVQSYFALALDADGRPIPVESSDAGFLLAEADPAPALAADAAGAFARPFPMGLATPVGVVVANPALSTRPGDYAMFGRDRYHGAVIWSWPIAVARIGLERQRARIKDPAARAALDGALTAVKHGEAGVEAVRGSELWSWSAAGGTFAPVPFGQRSSDATEANALQLWSNLDLAVDSPSPLPEKR